MNQKQHLFSSILIFKLFIVALVLTSGCQKEYPSYTPEPLPPEPAMFFKLNFDYKDIEATDSQVKPVKVGANLNADIAMDNHLFKVFIRDTMKLNATYMFEEEGMGKAAIYYRDTSDLTIQYKSQSGSLAVTDLDEVNKIVYGTFSGMLRVKPTSTLAQSRIVKEGKFKFQYK